PNNRNKLAAQHLRNRILTDTFEPGSTLKPFTVALALEGGRVRPDSVIQIAPGSLSIGAATIHDAHFERSLTVAQVIQKSSNVGAAKIALALSAESMWEMFRDVGFGTAPGLGFPGEAAGKLRPYRSWRPIEQATMSYGHGISVRLVPSSRDRGNDRRALGGSVLRRDRGSAGICAGDGGGAAGARRPARRADAADRAAPRRRGSEGKRLSVRDQVEHIQQRLAAQG